MDVTADATRDRVPFFTVGIPAYRSERFIAETIESVLAQTFSDWELVIVDDGSPDDTYEIAASYAVRDPRIRVRRTDHGGTGAARNAAFEGARSPYVCRLDHDDLYLPTYLETMRRSIEDQPGYDIYSCNGLRWKADGTTAPMLSGERWTHPTSVTFEELLGGNPIFAMATIGTDAYWRVGGTGSGQVAEDYEFWLRATRLGARHIYVPEVLGLYRTHAGQGSAHRAAMLESRASILRELASSDALSDTQLEICRRSIAAIEARIPAARERDRAAEARRRVEDRLATGHATGILPDYRGARLAYGDAAKYYAGLAVGIVSERLLGRLLSAQADEGRWQPPVRRNG